MQPFLPSIADSYRRWKASTVMILLLLLLANPNSQGQQAAHPDKAGLDQVLRQMENVGKSFKSFAALFTQKKYTAVLKEFSIPEAGEFYYERAPDGSALLRQEIMSPGKRILTIKGGIATLFEPVIKQGKIINLGKNRDKAEFLAIGIGQSPAKLRDTFNIEYGDTEPVAGAPCSVLILKPKNPSAAALFSSITLWIKKSNGLPIRQKLQEPSGDYLLIDFTNEKLNPKIAASKFEQKLGRGIEILKP